MVKVSPFAKRVGWGEGWGDAFRVGGEVFFVLDGVLYEVGEYETKLTEITHDRIVREEFLLQVVYMSNSKLSGDALIVSKQPIEDLVAIRVDIRLPLDLRWLLPKTKVETVVLYDRRKKDVWVESPSKVGQFRYIPSGEFRIVQGTLYKLPYGITVRVGYPPRAVEIYPRLWVAMSGQGRVYLYGEDEEILEYTDKNCESLIKFPSC